ncbi:MAG: hypothetical protein FWB72_01385 [Firmicutes bacterium]|nr:hypothetical protein [Bacillota bacterium]
MNIQQKYVKFVMTEHQIHDALSEFISANFGYSKQPVQLNTERRFFPVLRATFTASASYVAKANGSGDIAVMSTSMYDYITRNLECVISGNSHLELVDLYKSLDMGVLDSDLVTNVPYANHAALVSDCMDTITARLKKVSATVIASKVMPGLEYDFKAEVELEDVNLVNYNLPVFYITFIHKGNTLNLCVNGINGKVVFVDPYTRSLARTDGSAPQKQPQIFLHSDIVTGQPVAKEQLTIEKHERLDSATKTKQKVKAGAKDLMTYDDPTNTPELGPNVNTGGAQRTLPFVTPRKPNPRYGLKMAYFISYVVFMIGALMFYHIDNHFNDDYLDFWNNPLFRDNIHIYVIIGAVGVFVYGAVYKALFSGVDHRIRKYRRQVRLAEEYEKMVRDLTR